LDQSNRNVEGEKLQGTFKNEAAAPSLVFKAVIEDANLWFLTGFRLIPSLLPL
jgi:hypothetical protein